MGACTIWGIARGHSSLGAGETPPEADRLGRIVQLARFGSDVVGFDSRQSVIKATLVFAGCVFKAALILAGLALTAAPAHAQLIDVPATWGGDLWSRPRLTGDWGGLRDDLGKKGIVLDVDLLLTPMAVVSGGRSTDSDLWGNVDYTLKVDTGKAGLWPGGLLTVQADTGFGANVQRDSGAIVPIDTPAVVPAPNDHTTALMTATFTQFLSTRFGVIIGKFYTLTSSPQEFYGDYNTQFLNAAFNFPMTLEQVPICAYGGGAVALPTKDITLSLIALDPNGTCTSNGLSNAFNNGVIIPGSALITITPFGLVGHQSFGFSWSNKERYSLEQGPSNLLGFLLQGQFPRLGGNPGATLAPILAQSFPGLVIPVEPPNQKSSSWSVNYGFDQYFWQPSGDAKHGIGVFFSAGVSDGNPNPIKFAVIAGIGGKGVPGRADDSYGVGFARTQFSGALVPFLRERLDLGLDYEDALETYYNLAITGWLSATADLQVVDPGLKRQPSDSGAGLTNVSTATIVGIRLRARF